MSSAVKIQTWVQMWIGYTLHFFSSLVPDVVVRKKKKKIEIIKLQNILFNFGLRKRLAILMRLYLHTDQA